MQCELCKQNEAVVHLKQVCNGETRELHVCIPCAAQNGFDVESSISVTDFLLGAGLQQKAGKSSSAGPTCPACHMRASEFRKTSRLGCSECYTAFAEELLPMIASVHGATRHQGKAPAKEGRNTEMASLQRALKDAIDSQSFEEAARLRDRIKELQQAVPPAAGGGAAGA